MKRATRIIHRMLSGFSLLLLLATAGVWVRSYWVCDMMIWFDWPDRVYLDRKIVECARGGIQFESHRDLAIDFFLDNAGNYIHQSFYARRYPVLGDDWGGSVSPRPSRYAALGFEWIPRTMPPEAWWGQGLDLRITSFTFPLYFPCLLFAILPAHFLLRLRRRRRIAKRIANGCCIA